MLNLSLNLSAIFEMAIRIGKIFFYFKQKVCNFHIWKFLRLLFEIKKQFSIRIAISYIADKFKLKFKRLFYAQGPEVQYVTVGTVHFPDVQTTSNINIEKPLKIFNKRETYSPIVVSQRPVLIGSGIYTYFFGKNSFGSDDLLTFPPIYSRGPLQVVPRGPGLPKLDDDYRFWVYSGV